MELADYLKMLRRRWWLVTLAVVLASVGAGAASLAQAPRYTTSTRLLVAGTSGGASAEESAARLLANQRAAAYTRLLTTGPAVALAVGAAGTPDAAPVVTAAADGSSPFILITVEASSAVGARALANAYAAVLPKIVETLEQAPASAVPTFTTLEAAPLPGGPTSPQPVRTILVGAVIGLILGFAGAVLRETLDARLRDSSEIEKLTQVSLLGSVPRALSGEALPARTKPRSARAEAYRHVRANLEFAGPDGMPASIAITSPAAGEGKSSLAANLAIVAAHAGRTVVIVDADLRKPTIAKYFGVSAVMGLSDVLTGRWRVDEVLVPIEGERIWVLPSGPVPSFPTELVGSAAMAAAIVELEQRFDLVIVDTPPVLPVSDALHVAVNVGGVIVVARMTETRRVAMKRAVEAITKVNANVLGVVGNAAVKQEEKNGGYGYGYGYGGRRGDQGPAPAVIQPASRRADGPRGAARHGRRAMDRARETTSPAAAPAESTVERFDLPMQSRVPDALGRGEEGRVSAGSPWADALRGPGQGAASGTDPGLIHRTVDDWPIAEPRTAVPKARRSPFRSRKPAPENVIDLGDPAPEPRPW